MRTWLPGAAEKEPFSTKARGGARWSTALTVVSTTAGLSVGRQEPRERRHPPGDDSGMRRDAIVGEAVPGRERQRLDLGREEGERALDLGEALAITGDEDGSPFHRPCQFAERLADIAVGNPGERDHPSGAQRARQALAGVLGDCSCGSHRHRSLFRASD